MYNPKGFSKILIGIIVTFALLGTSGYFLLFKKFASPSQSPRPQSQNPAIIPQPLLPQNENSIQKWKIYTSVRWGYTISYPANYFEKVGGNADCFAATSGDSDAPIFCVWFYDNPQKFSARDWWNNKNGGSSYLFERKSIKVAGQDALVFENPPSTLPEMDVVFAYEDKIIQISAGTPYDNDMLASFKFVSAAERVLLTPLSGKSYYNPAGEWNCNVQFNFDPPTVNVSYSNLLRGISISIPFNEKWGNEKYRINPYDEMGEAILFGPIESFEACAWVRSYSILFTKAETSEQVVSDLQKEGELSFGPVIEMMNNLTIVKYETLGLCSVPRIQVIGKKFNYDIGPTCGIERDKEFQFLGSVIQTLKLVD